MNENKRINNANDLTSEACAWIAQLESESMRADDLAAFKEWVERSPAHKQEIMRLARLSTDINVLTEMAAPLKHAAQEQMQLANLKTNKKWSKLRYAYGVFALITLSFFANYYLNPSIAPVKDPLLYATEVGAFRKIALSDGTQVELNTDSQIEVDYSKNRRKVRLLKGEAFFQVAHDKQRPFIVYADKKSVKAVGTAFVVSLLPQSFEVIVTEGKVALANSLPIDNQQPVTSVNSDSTLYPVKADTGLTSLQTDEEFNSPIYLTAGESVALNQTKVVELNVGQVKKISKREIQRKLSWQDGLLDFSDTPLREVIEDMSRYTSMKIEITDPQLSELKFGGLFRTDELQALFHALESSFDIKIEKISDKHVKISRNQSIDS